MTASVPEHLWRFPTRAAIEALGVRFDLPHDRSMSDWEWEVADPERIDEFIAAYQSGELDDDERFTLMEMILQSFDDLGDDVADDPRWNLVLSLLDANFRLHAHSIWYWARPESKHPEEQFAITPTVWGILDKHRDELLRSG
jgi:hypothetical protein